MSKISFKAIFLDSISTNLLLSRGDLLASSKKEMHITLALGDNSLVPDDSLGKRITVLVNGAGKSETNHGYRVELPEEIVNMYANFDTRVPHVTASLSAEGKARDTKDLAFEDIDPFFITGSIGIMMADGEIHYLRN